MKNLIIILLLISFPCFGQVDRSLRIYVKQYNDSMKPHLTPVQFRSVFKVEYGDLIGDWKTHSHLEGYHVIIAKRRKKLTLRQSVFQALDAAHFKLIKREEL